MRVYELQGEVSKLKNSQDIMRYLHADDFDEASERLEEELRWYQGCGGACWQDQAVLDVKVSALKYMKAILNTDTYGICYGHLEFNGLCDKHDNLSFHAFP